MRARNVPPRRSLVAVLAEAGLVCVAFGVVLHIGIKLVGG